MNSLVTAFGLAGFFVGLVLYLFLLTLVLQRREKRALEYGLTALLASLLVWYSGNFVGLLLRQMDIDKVSNALFLVDAVSFSGLALLPALLFHTHWIYYRTTHPTQSWEKVVSWMSLVLLYTPLVLLPQALSELFPATQKHPISELDHLATPFLCLLALSYYASCFLQVRILQKSRQPVERAVFRRLLPVFAFIPLFNFYVFWNSGQSMTPFQEGLAIVASLSSVLPTAIVAYYIYHHRFLQIFVHRGVSFVLLLLVTLGLYLFGIHHLSSFFQREFSAPPLLVEGVFLSAILLLFPSISRWLGRQVESLFSGEIRRHRQLAESFQRSLNKGISPQLFQELVEDRLRHELGAQQVKIRLGEELPIPQPASSVPLAVGGRTLGYIEISPASLLSSSSQREALGLLANEIAFVVERSRLLATKGQLERQLEQKSHVEELGTMAASVAHNVKNPLSSIKTLMQLLQEADNLTEEQHHEISMMIREIDRLSKTVTNLLRFTRQDLPPDSSLKKVDLEYTLRSVESVFRGELRARGITLETRVFMQPAVIESDPDTITDILSNLIANAIEASPSGAVIRVDVRKSNSEVELSVEDEGPGIPPEVREKMFQPFFTTKKRGTGLGLAIVEKRLVWLGGTLRLENPSTGKGTRFTVTLPSSLQPGAVNAQNPPQEV